MPSPNVSHQDQPASLWPLYLAILAFPFGIALQNLVWWASMLLLGVAFWRLPAATKRLRLHTLGHPAQATFGAGLGFLLCLILASVLNPAQSWQRWASSAVGYLPWLVLPYLYKLHFISLTTAQWRQLGRLVAYTGFVWGLVALSQYLFGWRLLGASLTSDLPRPRGLYSHPLSLAYALLLVWPLAVLWLCRQARSLQPWLLIAGLGLGLTLTQSRTVQVVAFAFLCFALWRRLQGRQRWQALAVVALLTALIGGAGFTRKFQETLSSQGLDRFSSYPDDRLAFWHAHWLMSRERPWSGHGMGLDTAYRQAYYEELGLGSFKKKYEAHNIYLQILAEGGVVGLLSFCLWLYFFFLLCRQLASDGLARQVGQASLACFLIACITQNGFQDGSVRSGILLLWAAILIASGSSRQQTRT